MAQFCEQAMLDYYFNPKLIGVWWRKGQKERRESTSLVHAIPDTKAECFWHDFYFQVCQKKTEKKVTWFRQILWKYYYESCVNIRDMITGAI